jgi:hypothetical protein
MTDEEFRGFPVPVEVMEIWYDYQAMQQLRDEYIKLPFGFRKARKTSKEAQRLRGKFWRKCREAYPDVWLYKETRETVFIDFHTESLMVRDEE